MSLDVFQQVFALSRASGAVNYDKGRQKTLQEQLQSQLNSALPLIGADWKLVWGPVVWKHAPENASTGPDNSWYIAYHPNLQYEDGSVHPTYVIAIAGTPAKSLYVWAQENFAVITVSNFKAWVANGIQNPPFPSLHLLPDGAYIATGTVNTIHLLLTTTSPESAASPGTTLLDFITNVDQSACPRFISTGHSLGGALSPSLALALVTAGAIPADRTLTYPTAGPSPGDVGFTELFVQTFPPRKLPGAASYQGWNLNLVNTLDPVPQAWAINTSLSPKQNLFDIPGLYGDPILIGVKLTVWLGAIWSGSSGVVYKSIPSQYFTGTPPPAAPTDLSAFLKVVSREHVDAYTAEVGISMPLAEEDQVLRAGLTRKTVHETRYNFPVIIDFEWALDNPEQAQEIQAKVQASVEVGGFSSGLGGLKVSGVSGVSGVPGVSGGLGGLSGLGKII